MGILDFTNHGGKIKFCYVANAYNNLILLQFEYAFSSTYNSTNHPISSNIHPM